MSEFVVIDHRQPRGIGIGGPLIGELSLGPTCKFVGPGYLGPTRGASGLIRSVPALLASRLADGIRDAKVGAYSHDDRVELASIEAKAVYSLPELTALLWT